jgi:exodeoxyribonuclease V alpha subunit
VTVVGSAVSVTVGKFVEYLGFWNNDRQHGLQFKANELKIVPPTTLEGIEKYLGSGMVKDIGPHFAKKLMKAFGADVFDVIEQTPERLGFHPVHDIQVLTPMNRGGLGARSLNIELQARLNGDSEPKITKYGSTYAPGDKVIQNVNNYDKEVFNGDIGTVQTIDLEESLLQIQFDDRLVEYEFNELDEISLAYATSIHKSQGSEYPVVVIPLAMSHYLLLERNLLYTGVTRGKRLVVIVAQPKALGMAVRTQRSQKRLTNLVARLR